MKQVMASVLTHDASIGRVEPGVVYSVDDDKAERWIQNGIATAAPAKPPEPEPQPGPTPPEPQPEPEPEEEDEDSKEDEDDGPEPDPVQLAADAHKLHDEGLSERAIAQQLGVSRTRVHQFLQS